MTELLFLRHRRRSRTVLVRLLVFVALVGVRGWVSVSVRSTAARYGYHSNDSRCFFSTSGTATLSPPAEIESSSENSGCGSDDDSSVATRKRLGKSSFLYKQIGGNADPGRGGGEPSSNENPLRTTPKTAEDLRRMAERHSGKTVGSSQYRKAFMGWLEFAVESIREDLGERLLVVPHSGTYREDDSGTTGTDTTDATAGDPQCDSNKHGEIREAFERLFFDLGVAADVGKMPSFEDGAARKGYALEFFCRGRSLAEFLLKTPAAARDEDEHDEEAALYPGFWSSSLRSPGCPILSSSSSDRDSPGMASLPESALLLPSTYEIVSLGGGPGFDFVGVALAASFSCHTGARSSHGGNSTLPSSLDNIHVTVMDYEEGWSDLVSAMDLSTRKLLSPPTPSGEDEDESSLSPSTLPSTLPSMSCDWGGKCDITRSILSDPVNSNCRRLLLGDENNTPARLWICQYCVAENAKILRDSDYVFVKELVQEMPVGTMLLLTEVTPRLWPEIARILHREGLLESVAIGFCKGYGGKQFLLRKRCSTSRGVCTTTNPAAGNHDSRKPHRDGDVFESFDDRTREQLEHFERLASYHERKVESGWKRQGRKANGSVYHDEQLRHRRQRSSGE